MNEKDEIVREFSKYCSKCSGLCCKRGVFTVFEWENEKLTQENKDFKDADVFDQRGGCRDIAMHSLCMFSDEKGCKLPMEIRPTDCISFPFYPKMKENAENMEIESILIQNECPFSEEISKNKKLVTYMNHFWKLVIKKATKQEITDWIGENGCWGEWYKNAISVNCQSQHKVIPPETDFSIQDKNLCFK